MKITIEDVEKAALLSRLELKDEEKAVYTEQLNSILEYAEALKKIDTSNVPPTAHVLNLTNVFREDEVKEHLPNDKALQNAPKKSDGSFRVPKII